MAQLPTTLHSVLKCDCWEARHLPPCQQKRRTTASICPSYRVDYWQGSSKSPVSSSPARSLEICGCLS